MSAADALRAARAAGMKLGIDGDALMLEAAAAPPPVMQVKGRDRAALPRSSPSPVACATCTSEDVGGAKPWS
jgi:hypothetical protein